MSTSVILAGLGLAVIGFAGRYALRASRGLTEAVQTQWKAFPTMESIGSSRYYKGGFDQKMTRREAGLVLGVSPAVTKAKLKEAHKRIMLLNHPDRALCTQSVEINKCLSNLKKLINTQQDELEDNIYWTSIAAIAYGESRNRGSPYIASKINEAKDILESGKP